MRTVFSKHWFIVLLLLVGMGGFLVSSTATAQANDLEKLDTSLKLIPADAAFYSSMLRNREQIDLFLESNAFQQLKAMPMVEIAIAYYRMEALRQDSELAKALAILENPQSKKLLALLEDMVSDEIFIYGDENCSRFVHLCMKLNNSNTLSSYAILLGLKKDNRSFEQYQAQLFLEALTEDLDELVVPNMLVGFRLKKPAGANEALIKLETIVDVLIPQLPPCFKDSFKRETIAGHEYLVWRLNGEMIPWDSSVERELELLGIESEDREALIEHLKEMKLVIALGVRENYLLASIGSSTEAIEKLGTGDRLLDRPEFKPLQKFTGEKLTGITYVSKELNHRLKSLSDLFDTCRELVVLASERFEWGESETERITSDVDAFFKDLQSYLPENGAILAFNFLTSKGIEGYTCDWGKYPQIDSSRPLSLFEHVGGNPLFATVSRNKVDIHQYDLLVKWLTVGKKYFDEFVLSTMSPNEQEKAETLFKEILPLLARIDKANRESLFPALADGQSALIIDGKFTTKKLHADLLEWEKDMPLPELGIVFAVNDPQLLKKGVGEYYSVLGDLIEVLRKHNPGDIPEDFKLPEPQISQTDDQTIYSFPLPSEWEFDERIVPNAGLSKNVAVIALSRRHTERLLKPTPFTNGGVLTKTDRPMTSALSFNIGELVESSAPWFDLLITNSPVNGSPMEDMTRKQTHTILDVLKCLRSFSFERYVEDDCLVNHTLLEISDIPKK